MSKDVRTILCPINLRHAAVSTHAYDRALGLARLHGAKLLVVTVAPEIERNLNIYDSDRYWRGKLNDFLAEHPPGDVDVDTRVLKGAVHRRIVKAAEADDVDLIVMEAANPKVKDYLLGTTASHVATHAECSVYVVR